MRVSLGGSPGYGAMRSIIIRGLGGCALLLLASLLAAAATVGPHGTWLGFLMLAGSIVTFAGMVVWSRRRGRPLEMGSIPVTALLGSIAITFVALAISLGVIGGAVFTFAALTYAYGLIIAPVCAIGLKLIWSSLGAIRARRADPGGAAT